MGASVRLTLGLRGKPCVAGAPRLGDEMTDGPGGIGIA